MRENSKSAGRREHENKSPIDLGLNALSGLLDRFVRSGMKVNGTPGVAVALTDRHDTLRVSTYGYSDVAARIPLSPEMLFNITSIAKSFTCIALLQLLEEGKLDLHRPVKDYLPWFEVRSKHEPITIHHLMTHTGGIVGGALCTPYGRSDVWTLRGTEATAPPGTFFHYSDTGYNALGLVLEEILGKSYGEIIRERIVEPLGMTATTTAFTSEMRGRLACGYAPLFDDRPHPRGGPIVHRPMWEYDYAAGAVASTPVDMAIYLRTLLNLGRGPRSHILSNESARLMTEPHVKTDGPTSWGGEFYGYGLRVGDVEGHRWIGHGGGVPSMGYMASMVADLTEGLGIVVLTNGPGEPWEVSHFGLRATLAARSHKEVPNPPETSPMRVEGAADYAGIYRCGDLTLEISAKEEHLFLRSAGDTVPLGPRGPDAFYVAHPAFDRFLLRFGREEGRVTEAFHGSDSYVSDRYGGSGEVPVPAEWAAYAGHYASYNPFIPHFRIVLRKGELVFVEYLEDTETKLIPLPDGGFRLSEDERSPERIHFDWIVKGKSLHASLSGGDYYRSFTA